MSLGAVLSGQEANHAVFLAGIVHYKLPRSVSEYRFAPPRRWRMDYAWPSHKLYLEVDGGVWTRGRHTRGVGWLKDAEKHNEAAARGWRMLRVTPGQLCTPETFDLIARCLKSADSS